MKRKILASILGIAASLAVTSSYGQGKIFLDTYDSTLNPSINYAAGSGGTVGAGIVNGTPAATTWTIGMYWALGSQVVGGDATGFADPSTLGGGLAFDNNDGGDLTTINAGAGHFANPTSATIEGYSSGVITMEVVAYSGSSYLNSAFRGHSAAFTMTPATGNNTAPNVGDSMPSFSVFPVPEPSIFALAGMGAAALMAFRRKK